jgi:hypothetical protein
VGKKSYPKVDMQGLVQRFGDCWFFSGWNGFLLSYRGRKFLREYLSYERPEATHNRFWNVTRQFLNFGPFKLSKENTRTIISSVNQTVNAGASNYYAFKVLNRLFGNKIAYNLNLLPNNAPRPLVIIMTFDFTKPNQNGKIEPGYNFREKDYVISHARINIEGHSMTGVIDANGKEFIFDAGFGDDGQFWEFEWTKGPLRDKNGNIVNKLENYQVFYVLEELMNYPNKPVYVRPIAGRPPIRRVKKPAA